MTSFERDALGAICLLAAFADGEPAPAELERLKAITSASGSGASGISHEVYQRVMFKQVDVSTEAGRLSTPELRMDAFELAVGVCDSDGVTTDAERAFLMKLAEAPTRLKQPSENSVGFFTEFSTTSPIVSSVSSVFP